MQKLWLGLAMFALLALQSLQSARAAEDVQINHGGMLLNAAYEKAGADTPERVVVMLHGTLAHNRMEIMTAFRKLLAEQGVASLSVNLSLGISDRDSAMYDCPTLHQHQHSDAVGELKLWVDWLAQQGVQEVVMLGHSRGGNQVARYMADAPHAIVKSAVLVAPATQADYGKSLDKYAKDYGADMRALLKEAQARQARGDQAPMALNFIYCRDTQALPLSVISYYREDADMHTPTVLTKTTHPILVVAGGSDNVVADLPAAMESIADGERVRFEVVDDADHFFRDFYAEDTVALIMEFIG
ncbi:MAG: alpha/beta fold hydrolase [Gammaproteobacteria bacterium]